MDTQEQYYETLEDHSPYRLAPSPSEAKLPFEGFLGEEEEVAYSGEEEEYSEEEEEEDPFCSDSVQFGSFKGEAKMFDKSLEELEGTERVGFRYRGIEYYCEVCDVRVTSMAALQDHFAGTRHQKRLKQVGLDVDLTDLVKCPGDPELKRKLLRCKLCDVIVRGSEMSVHTRCANHQEKLQFFEEEDQPDDAWFNEVAVNPDSFLKSLDDGYHCDLCGVTLPSNDLFRKHLDGKRHQKKLRWEFLEQTENTHGDSNQLQYWCKICNIFCTSKEALDKHFTGKKHVKMLKSKGVLTEEDGGLWSPTSDQEIGCGGDFASSEQRNVSFDPGYTEYDSISSGYNSSSGPRHSSSSGHGYSGHTSYFEHSSSGRSSSGHSLSECSSSRRSSGHVSSSGHISPSGSQSELLEQRGIIHAAGNQVQYWCKICDIFCTSEDALDKHFVGKKHAKVLKSKGMLPEDNVGDNSLQSASSSGHGSAELGSSLKHSFSSGHGGNSARRSSSGHVSSSGHISSSMIHDQPPLENQYGQLLSIRRCEQDKYKRPLSIHEYEQQLSIRQHQYKQLSRVHQYERPSSSTSSQRSSHSEPTKPASAIPFAITPFLKSLSGESEPDSTSSGVTFDHISSKQQAVSCVLCDKMLESNAEIREHLDSQEHLAALFPCQSNIKLQDIIIPARKF